MKLPRDRVPYSAIVDRPPLKLPGGARVAVWTIVNVEEWSIERAMPRTVLPPPYGQPLLPDLPTLPELAALLHAPAHAVAGTVTAMLADRSLGASHRAVLVNFVARAAPGTLPELAAGLDALNPSLPSIGLSFALADLARLRHRMLTELEPS